MNKIKPSDIKVDRITSDHTFLQKWQTYYFMVWGYPRTYLVEKSGGVFRFYSAHPKTLKEAKTHLASMLNSNQVV